MKYTVIELHNAKHQPIYLVREMISDNMNAPVYPIIRYKTREAAQEAIKQLERPLDLFPRAFYWISVIY